MSAITQGTDRKTAVCTRRFAYAPLTIDNATTVTYGDVTEIDNALITVQPQPTYVNGSQYASGVEIDSYTAKAGGTLNITVAGLNAADEVALFGSTLNTTTGVLESGPDDVVKDVMVIYSTTNSDGKVNLYKYPKCKFSSQGETVQTTDNNGITYNATSLVATYKPLINKRKEVYTVKGLDPTTDATFIEAWFSTATGGIVASS